jgi:hypothetical protein
MWCHGILLLYNMKVSGQSNQPFLLQKLKDAGIHTIQGLQMMPKRVCAVPCYVLSIPLTSHPVMLGCALVAAPAVGLRGLFPWVSVLPAILWVPCDVCLIPALDCLTTATFPCFILLGMQCECY